MNRDNDIAVLQKLQTSIKTIKSDLGTELANMRKQEDNSNDLFIATKRAQALLDKLKASLEDITIRTKYREYDLQKDGGDPAQEQRWNGTTCNISG